MVIWTYDVMHRKYEPVVCYKTKKPVVYNKGTEYEYSTDTYNAYFAGAWRSLDDINAEIDNLNKNKPATLWNGEPINWDKVDYFFLDFQQGMY